MPQHLLHAAQIRARVQKVRREAVPQLVRRQVGRQLRLGEIAFHPPLDEPRRQRPSRVAHEDRRAVGRLRAVARGTFAAQLLERGKRGPAEDHEPVLRPLARDDDRPLRKIDLAPGDRNRLADAAARRIEELEDGRVAARGVGGDPAVRPVLARSREEAPDVLDRQHLRQQLRLARALERGERIVDELALALEEAEERAAGRELAAHRRRRRPVLRQVREERARVALARREPRIRRPDRRAPLEGDELREIGKVAVARVRRGVALREEVRLEAPDERIVRRRPVRRRFHHASFRDRRARRRPSPSPSAASAAKSRSPSSATCAS